MSAFGAGLGATFAVIAAGERWPGEELRPCLEDLLGAGAVLSGLPGQKSPEAQSAMAAFRQFEGNLHSALSGCSSGKELIERGFDADVALPWLYDGAFVDAHPTRAPASP